MDGEAPAITHANIKRLNALIQKMPHGEVRETAQRLLAEFKAELPLASPVPHDPREKTNQNITDVH